MSVTQTLQQKLFELRALMSMALDKAEKCRASIEHVNDLASIVSLLVGRTNEVLTECISRMQELERRVNELEVKMRKLEEESKKKET